MAQAAQDAITCPAGTGVESTLHGPACRCRILHETITRDENTHTLTAYCAGDYKTCNVWRAARDADLEGQGRSLQRDINRSAKGTNSLPVVVG